MFVLLQMVGCVYNFYTVELLQIHAFHYMWLINHAQDKHYRTHLSVQSRIDKEGVIFDPLFTDLGVIWWKCETKKIYKI